MTRSGRFGKYGDLKRKENLRKSRLLLPGYERNILSGGLTSTTKKREKPRSKARRDYLST